MTIIQCRNGIVQTRNNIVSFNGSMVKGRNKVEEKPKDLIADETKAGDENMDNSMSGQGMKKKLNRFISLKL